MGKTVFVILFLLAACLRWTAGEACAGMPAACGAEGVERQAGGEVRPEEDKVLLVLAEANRCAEMSVRSGGQGFNPAARRHRTPGNAWERQEGQGIAEWETAVCTAYKQMAERSVERSARRKDAGYYVYALRKIII